LRLIILNFEFLRKLKVEYVVCLFIVLSNTIVLSLYLIEGFVINKVVIWNELWIFHFEIKCVIILINIIQIQRGSSGEAFKIVFDFLNISCFFKTMV
jgi:hypothetical protein